ncbi:gamma-glutamyltransferase [Francisellaceae bacterium]|nr:gamma-glutamyltransferase [Francisellaceae bacterium]
MKRLFIFYVLIFFIKIGYTSPALQETTEIFHPEIAKNGMVSTQDYLATQVGVDILKKGGNAVDATVAVGFALAVTLPRAGNLGGGGFMVIWLNEKQKAIAINYREKAPSHASEKMYQDTSGNIIEGKSSDDYLASGVPGTVAGLILAQNEYGKLSLKEVMCPAINLAENGFVVSFKLSQAIEQAKDWLSRNKAAKAIYFRPDGKVLQPGDIWKQPDLAKTLKEIAIGGDKAFYEGEIAEKIVADMEKHGGLITAEDLKNYKPEIMQPVKGSYRGYTIYSMPPPSSGGVILIELLNILEGYPISTYGLNDAQYIHILAEAMSQAYYDRNIKLGDPDFVDNPTDILISKPYADNVRRSISLTKHTPSNKISHALKPAYESTETTQSSIVDSEGNMVANTYTLNYSFGNGQVIEGTGILMNNEMVDFTSKVGIPNAFGLIQGKANSIEPNKRPLSSMTPTIVLDKDGKPFLATGSPGGSRIITTVLQVILNVIDHNLNIQTAVSLPRMHNQLWPDEIRLEQGFSDDTIHILEVMGHKVKPIDAMGSAETIQYNGNLYFGAADPRRPGAKAEGY